MRMRRPRNDKETKRSRFSLPGINTWATIGFVLLSLIALAPSVWAGGFLAEYSQPSAAVTTEPFMVCWGQWALIAGNLTLALGLFLCGEPETSPADI